MIIKQPTNLRIPFRGERDYISGCDIIHACLELVPAHGSLSFKIHTIIRHELLAFSMDKFARCNVHYCAGFQCGDANIALIEDTSRRINDSVFFDEETIVRDSDIKGQIIEQQEPSIGSIYERIVYLNKALLNKTVAPAKWWFVALDLKTIPPETSTLQIALNWEMRGLYRSAVRAGGRIVGDVFFMRDKI